MLIFYIGIFINRVRELYIGVQSRLMTSKSFYKIFLSFRALVHLKNWPEYRELNLPTSGQEVKLRGEKMDRIQLG